MIRMHVDAVFTLYDGFTGKAMPPSAVRVMLDGQRFRPEYRQGGYLVFINLEPGNHKVVFSAAYYGDETADFETMRNSRVERVLSLKPGLNYPFGGKATRLTAIVTAKGKCTPKKRVALAAGDGPEIRVAQDSAAAGDSEFKLYVRGELARLKLPGEYLIVDGKNSEVCTLSAVNEGTGRFAAPLIYEHKRGKALILSQTYTTDENGVFTAFFRRPAGVHAFVSENSILLSRELEEGENEMEINI